MGGGGGGGDKGKGLHGDARLELDGDGDHNEIIYDNIILCGKVYLRFMCHGVGVKVGWIKEYRGLTFTM